MFVLFHFLMKTQCHRAKNFSHAIPTARENHHPSGISPLDRTITGIPVRRLFPALASVHWQRSIRYPGKSCTKLMTHAYEPVRKTQVMHTLPNLQVKPPQTITCFIVTRHGDQPDLSARTHGTSEQLYHPHDY